MYVGLKNSAITLLPFHSVNLLLTISVVLLAEAQISAGGSTLSDTIVTIGSRTMPMSTFASLVVHDVSLGDHASNDLPKLAKLKPESQFLRHLQDTSPVSSPTYISSPELLSPINQPPSPETFYSDINTQLSLVQKSEDLTLASNGGETLTTLETGDLWQCLNMPGATMPGATMPGANPTPRKLLKSSEDATVTQPLSSTMPTSSFDANGAVSDSEFVFTKFGSDVPGVFTFGPTSQAMETVTSSISSSTSVTSR